MSEKNLNMSGEEEFKSSVASETTNQTSPDQEERAKQERELEEHSAAEFLLGFKDLRADVHQEAVKVISSIEGTIAKGKNLLSSPRNFLLYYRVESTKQKYDRVSKKLDSSRFDFINRHYENKAQGVSSDLDSRTKSYVEHTEKMQDRLGSVEKHNKERQEVIDAKRKELHEERVAAVERRIARHERAKQRRKLEHEYSQYAYKEREAAINKYIEQPVIKKRIRFQAEKIVRRQKEEKVA